MASYTSDAKLLVELPSSLPSTLSSAVRAQYISDASAEVDSRVGPRYGLDYATNTQRFPDITDDPATPEVIEQIARWLAAARCYRKLGDINRDVATGMSTPERYEKQAWELLKEIKTGGIQIVDSDGTDLAGTEPLLDSTTLDKDLEFTKGEYEDGSLVSDEAGTLDGF